MPQTHDGGELESIGRAIEKKEMRQMVFMEESEKYAVKKRSPLGKAYGQLRSYANMHLLSLTFT